MESLLIKIGSWLMTPLIVLTGLFSPTPVVQEISSTPIIQEIETPTINVGAVLPQATGAFETTLQTPITATATSMTLSANAVRGTGAVSGYTCFTIDQGSAQAEITCGTVSSTSVTSMTRGISYSDGVTSVTANKFAHRRGANIKITDFPILQILKAQNNGDATFPNALQYASGIGPTASSDLADKEYVLSVVNGGSVTFEKVVLTGTAGETISVGQLVYLKSSDSRWWLTDADTASTVENVIIGIAQGAGTAGTTITNGVLIKGIDANQTGLSANTVYYASNTAGGASSSAGTKEVTVGIAKSTTEIVFFPRYNQQLTEDEQDAIAGGSTFGTPSASNKFITQDYNSSATGLPVTRNYTTTSSTIGSSTTQFDITNPSGTTFRYTYDTTGTDPTIDCTANPIGTLINFQTQNFTSANNGVFKLTGCGSSYVEVTNASGVAEVNKTIGTGYITESGTTGWSKPSGLKYITVEVQAGGGGGSTSAVDGSGGNYSVGSGGGGGGYSKEKIQASSLSATEYYLVGAGGIADNGGKISNFGAYLSATGGSAGNVQCSNTLAGGSGGVGSGGDINVSGKSGEYGFGCMGTFQLTSKGGDSFLGAGAPNIKTGTGSIDGGTGVAYGGGGGGGISIYSGGAGAGGVGADGIIIITEYYS